MACGTDFPKCLGQWLPAYDFSEAFVLWRGIGVDYEGGVLDGPARVAIQLMHRGMAVVVALYLIALAVKMIRTPGLVYWGSVLALLTTAQVAALTGTLLAAMTTAQVAAIDLPAGVDPAWLEQGQPSPTGRFSFTSWRLWKKGDPLQERIDCLIGPGTSIEGESRRISLRASASSGEMIFSSKSSLANLASSQPRIDQDE